ncbi:MAG TPA: VWA domain-containing protein [Myxococcota bacterium]|nr:VWA domain-containing protein [Myxococcota bacterium]
MRPLPLLLLAACADAMYYDVTFDMSGLTNPPSTGETYEDYGTNPWIDTTTQAVSTFSVDVDSGSYGVMRRDLNAGHLPEPAAIRVEEIVNYLDYGYAPPEPGAPHPFAVHLEAAPSPFGGQGRHLLRIGLKAREVPLQQRDPANLVFLVDVSGSMATADKLGLVLFSLEQLVDKLAPTDTLSLVVYASSEGLVLPPTPVEDKSVILDALRDLNAGGSTHGEAGIRLAYEQASDAFRPGGVNRVILCTDGDFNVGLTGQPLFRLIETYRDQGIFLTTLGFGMGNYNDTTLEQLADRGDGNYAYIDSQNEALRVLGDNLVSTLQVVAKDVKVQVGFTAETVRRWRLIGYENRVLNQDDFEDDAVDAGDIGAGHDVTALYELELADGAAAPEATLAGVDLRYKAPEGGSSQLLELDLPATAVGDSFEGASRSLRLAASVTEMAEILRHSEHSEGADWTRVRQIAEEAIGPAPTPVEEELLGLMQRAGALWDAESP